MPTQSCEGESKPPQNGPTNRVTLKLGYAFAIAGHVSLLSSQNRGTELDTDTTDVNYDGHGSKARGTSEELWDWYRPISVCQLLPQRRLRQAGVVYRQQVRSRAQHHIYFGGAGAGSR